jgi:hypothetical protein
MPTVAECLWLAFVLEVACFTLCTCQVDSVLSQTMPKLTIDKFYDLSHGRYCWRRCLVSKLLCWRDVSSWCCIVSLFVLALEHPDALECQVSKMSHMLVVIRCIGSNVGYSSHDRGFFIIGQ